MRTGDIQAWLVENIARVAEIAPDEIDVSQPFAAFGLASREAVVLSGDLEELLARELSPTLLYDYPTIATLAAHLGREPGQPDRETRLAPTDSSEPIAIIGIGCRFPGAEGPDEFWDLLRHGVDAITEVPGDRWPADDFYDRDPHTPGRAVTRWGGFVHEVDRFDPFFFGISPGEAERMDPQQRLLMEVAYEALEHGGQVPAALAGDAVGVFIGVSGNEYAYLQIDDTDRISGHSGTGNALSIVANRISYFFDLRGPSLAIDTACSSSLAAIHLACRSLRTGECGMAIAGGVNVMLSPALSIAFTKAGVMAPDGRCKAFDARADGYVRGEGAGLVVLKPLTLAIADADPIYAVIRGSAMNQDGRSNGLMAPSRDAQEAVLRAAYEDAGIEPERAWYVEAHGTGTILGDPIEAGALAEVLSGARRSEDLLVGSVKTNIGHLEAAAGVAGVIKVALGLQHGSMPPSLNYKTPNPHIPFEKWQMRVTAEAASVPSAERPTVAGVSSFGFGGSNVHVVMEEAPPSARPAALDDDPAVRDEAVPSSDTVTNVHILPVSAHTPQALDARLRMLRHSIMDGAARTASLRDICYTASVRRSHHDVRVGITGRSRGEISDRLEAAFGERGAIRGEGVVTPIRAGQSPLTVFVFPGQGAQWPGMGRSLIATEPVFRAALEASDKAMGPYLDGSIVERLVANERLAEIDLVQPAIFAVQVGLAALWQSWGVEPDAVIGHSMGEVAAAYVAGGIDLVDAARTICLRSKLMRRLSGSGGMAVAELTPDRAKAFVASFGGDLAVAAHNSPTLTVLSGGRAVLEDVRRHLNSRGLFCRLVDVDVPSHSAGVDSIREQVREALAGLTPRTPTVPMISTVTGRRIDGPDLDAEYWVRNLREPVRFLEAIEHVTAEGHDAFLEISAHPVLSSAVREQTARSGGTAICLPSLRRDEEERLVMLESLAALYEHGLDPSWERLYTDGGRCVPLPRYPWQRSRFWAEIRKPPSSRSARNVARGTGDLLGFRIDLAHAPGSRVWTSTVDPSVAALFEDHRIAGEVLFPAAAFMAMARQAADQAGVAKTHVVSTLRFSEKLVLRSGAATVLQTTLVPGRDERFDFRVHSRSADMPDAPWTLHAHGELRPSTSLEETAVPPLRSGKGGSLASIQRRCTNRVGPAAFYDEIRRRGLEYGPGFRGLAELWQGQGEALGELRVPEALRARPATHDLHPALLDACLQVVAAARNGSAAAGRLYLPVECRRVREGAAVGSPTWSHAVVRPIGSDGRMLEADIHVLDEAGDVVLEVRGLSLLGVTTEPPGVQALSDTWIYETVWQRDGPATEPDSSSDPAGTSWLILTDETGVGTRLATRLRSRGARCETLELSDLLGSRSGAGRVGPSESALSDSLRERLEAFEGALTGVVHLWTISAVPTASLNPEALTSARIAGCESLLALVQAIVNAEVPTPGRLWIATRGAQPVGYEEVAVAQAPVWGLGKTIGFELPELGCSRIDLDPLVGPDLAADALYEAILTDQRGEDEIAVRNDTRYVPRVRTREISGIARTGDVIHPDGTYVITGGLGALGLAVARWMIDRGARSIALLGRSPPGPDVEAALEALRGRDVRIEVVEADVAHADRLAEAIERIDRTMTSLRGVVHAAGILEDAALVNLDAPRMAAVMAPKVEGTWNLHTATAGHELDFFVAFSSAVSVLGSPGQGNYAAGSAFLDAMAHYRQRTGLPAISINWGPWASVGLAAAADERLREHGSSAAHLVKAFDEHDGMRALDVLVRAPEAQLMALPFDLASLIELHAAAAKIPRFAEIAGPETSHISRLYARPALRHEYVAPRSPVERKLAELWRHALHIDRVGIHDSFFALGGDSVLAAQIVTRAESAFGVHIDLQEAFEALTIEQFAVLLEERLLSKIDRMSESEAERLLTERGQDGPD